jgi:hypothetical protein
MPERSSKYLRRKVLPERGNEAKAILLDFMGEPSRKIGFFFSAPAKIHLAYSHIYLSFDLRMLISMSKLTTAVSGLALILMLESSK